MKFPNPFSPPPAPPGPISKLFFNWLTPFLSVGFSRPLEKDDFWTLPDRDLAATVTNSVERNFYARCSPDKRPLHLKDELRQEGEIEDGAQDDTEKNGKGNDPATAPPRKRKYNESLFGALHQTFFTRIWVAGFLRLFADSLKTTTPLVNKVLLQWLTDSYVFHNLPEAERDAAVAAGQLARPRGIGFGIGLAVAVFAMQEIAMLMMNHSVQISMTTGLSVRTGVIGSIFRKSLRISGRGRADHSVGQITTMISADATRMDRFTYFGHVLWIAPIQLAIGIGLLIGNLGYSALVGLGVLVISFPLQIMIVRVMFKQRMKGLKFTDRRVRLTTEVLQGIRLLKYFAWEGFYMNEITGLRRKEIRALKIMAIARSTMISMMTLIPILAAVLSFITYALTGHDLNVATIFTALQLFNIIRMPLVLFPFVLSGLSDALAALGRIGKFLTAEELPKPYDIKDSLPGIAVTTDGDFTWETVGKPEDKPKKAGKKDAPKKAEEKLPQHNDTSHISEKGSNADEKDRVEVEEKPFQLNNVKLTVPKGAFVGIVGRVGSGKSSLLQALIGEMRKTRGNVVFGGSVAYAPQTPWIRNATLRQNILFGLEDDGERFSTVIKSCSLEHDIEVLPNGELTEIGEKGINLSGGQKARVSLARCAYSRSEIVLLDDPLSAVDAYVGKAILDNCLLKGPLADRTRILVTHSLHVLDKLDYIYVMEQGEIVEQGTYDDLMANSEIFSKLVEEYGNSDSDIESEHAVPDIRAPGSPKLMRTKSAPGKHVEDDKESVEEDLKMGPDTNNGALMQDEERVTGAVTWRIYKSYMRYAGGLYWGPWILLLLVLAQGAGVGNALFLGFWTAESIPGFKQGHYMAVYGSLGIGQALFTFFLSFSFTFACLTASLNLFTTALGGVLRSPLSFFDTTPMGRILSRLSKDQDTLDTEMSMVMFQFSNTLFSVLGTVVLVFYTFPYLGIIFVPLILLYQLVSVYYRRTSVETKRWDSLLRSILYASYSESLTGLSTIRAYREQSRSIRDAEHGLDMQNRAYYMIIATQRWLSVRLDLFGNVLVFGIGLFAAGFRTSVEPAKIGVVLSYTLSITQFFSEMVNQYAQNEQNMNAVERVLHYSDLPNEGDLHRPKADSDPEWPPHGKIQFHDVKMAYRQGLPLVLKGISFDIRPGEKVGIVGRTGAGKSSLMQVLFRMVELQSGKVEIDGVNIQDIGLDTLRSRLALVPQDSILFLGTLRDNLDPQRLRTDAELISVLQRAWLLPRDGTKDPVAEAKFSLDSSVGDEGSNFSAGEKQLLALCRALVKNSRVIVLDEATSSVDVETDAKLQRTIQAEFTQSTLLCIAHRLNTIAYYDRILVMDEGRVAEFDTVLNLFDKEDSIFRSLCDEAKLQRADIIRIRSENQRP
ncbi:multidrug resistance-associated ABC transporter [Coprinellus micaceus]|uniref:Multidrug resistance-associated ABC transporter n=1 Tax=Coprinellus micaceus TaxID=71717 RepID=A0A4Y7T9L7_COPMI|nr:multidrug resistance-associated ABC transporter [Coprinellus micaceus]